MTILLSCPEKKVLAAGVRDNNPSVNTLLLHWDQIIIRHVNKKKKVPNIFALAGMIDFLS